MEQIQNSSLEFHDSEVSSVEAGSSAVVVKFSAAYVHRSDGRPGIDAGAGYVQALELVCSGSKVTVHEEGCIGRISDGTLVIGGVEMSMVPIPYEANTETRLEIQFTNGSRFCAQGTGVLLRAVGEANFVEVFPC